MTQGNSGAQSKLGELFVDFGTKGVGGLLKNLNTVSASFLLGKNAANQFAQTLTKPIKESGNAAVAAGKLSTQLATSYKEAMRLQLYLKQKNTSEGLLSELAALQSTWADFEKGFGGLGQIPLAFRMLGLNIGDYNSSLESMLELLDDARIKLAGFDDVTANQILGKMKLSNEWRYLWERGGNLLDAKTVITDEQIDENIKNAEAMAKLGTTTEQIWLKISNVIAPVFQKILGWLNDKGENLAGGEYDEPIKKGFKLLYLTSMGASDVPYSQTAKDIIKLGSSQPIPASIKGTNGVPPNSVQNSSVQIINNNNIQGTNATDIANKVNNKTRESFEYSQYQANNSPSL